MILKIVKLEVKRISQERNILWSEKSKQKLRERNKKQWESGVFSTKEYREKLKKSIKDAWKDNHERKKKISKITKNEWNKKDSALRRNDTVIKRNKSLSEVWADQQRRFIQKENQKKSWSDPELRETARIRSTENFKNDDYIEKYKKGRKAKPNKPEKLLINILDLISKNNYSYVGDFKVWIGGKNPDFICEDKMKIIEFFGTYYHKESDEKTRSEHFLNYGYKTLVIWENELDDIENVKQRIIDFNGDKNV